MRKVMFAMNISIDGCYSHTYFAPNGDLMNYFTQLMSDTGVIVYGRKTYELMIPFWPTLAESKDGRPEDIAFAKAMTPIPKIVISRTLKCADQNTNIISEDPEGLLRKPERPPGKMIASSSASMPGQMLPAGLIDEPRLIVHPLPAGDGKHLSGGFHSPEKHNFKLTKSQVFQPGAIAFHYEKNDNQHYTRRTHC